MIYAVIIILIAVGAGIVITKREKAKKKATPGIADTGKLPDNNEPQ